MSLHFLSEEIRFPDIRNADEEGLLAIGGDLSEERLIHAYESGIFPWYSHGQPILWWSPDPRFILYTDKIRISKRMRSYLRDPELEFRINTAFEEVIHRCSTVPRRDQDGTWITREMLEAYIRLNKNGYAISFETWKKNKLVGGMYGVNCKDYFAGESMFSLESNASKITLINACHYLKKKGIELLDCQIYSEHLESMGAEFLSREKFRRYLSH